MAAPSARASVDIAAPIDTVWNILTALDAYDAWNPFVVQVVGAARPTVGTPLVLHVRWPDGSGMKVGERVSRVEAPGERAVLAWIFQGVLPTFGLVRAERVQTLTRLDAQTTRYESEEVFHGLLARFVPLKRVITRFHDSAQALKRHAEAQARS